MESYELFYGWATRLGGYNIKLLSLMLLTVRVTAFIYGRCCCFRVAVVFVMCRVRHGSFCGLWLFLWWFLGFLWLWLSLGWFLGVSMEELYGFYSCDGFYGFCGC